jgi:hypothetical protein
MAPPAVIETIEIFKHGGAGLGTTSPLKLIDKFQLEASEETLGNRVVPANHRAGPNCHEERAWRVVAGNPRSRTGYRDPNVELSHVADGVAPRPCAARPMPAYDQSVRPAHHSPQKQIDDHSQIEPALRGPEMGHIGHPRGIGPRHSEAPRQQVGTDRQTAPGIRVVR